MDFVCRCISLRLLSSQVRLSPSTPSSFGTRWAQTRGVPTTMTPISATPWPPESSLVTTHPMWPWACREEPIWPEKWVVKCRNHYLSVIPPICQVVLYNSNLTNLHNLTGDQIGAYFGYTIATCDINGDGLDDILIGAPMWTDFTLMGKFETGRVYVVYQDKNVSSAQLSLLKHGKKLIRQLFCQWLHIRFQAQDRGTWGSGGRCSSSLCSHPICQTGGILRSEKLIQFIMRRS